ncbi:hypothetical protein ACJX0J_041954, partial [Zea mays]
SLQSLFAAQQLRRAKLSVHIMFLMGFANEYAIDHTRISRKEIYIKMSGTAGSTNCSILKLMYELNEPILPVLPPERDPGTTPVIIKFGFHNKIWVIRVFGDSKEEHATHLWVFWLDQVPFLGHILSTEGVAVDLGKKLKKLLTTTLMLAQPNIEKSFDSPDYNPEPHIKARMAMDPTTYSL